MKKLIAIAVVFALIAGAAFADTAVSGSISVRSKLISDTLNDVENTAVTSGEVETAYVQLSGQNDDGTFGGLIRLRGNDGRQLYHRAYAWWKPIPQLNIFLGQDPDGKFGPYNAWTFFQGQESYAHDHDWGQWRAAFPGNWDTFGLALSVFPIQGLEVDIVVPIGGTGKGSGAGTGVINSWENNYADINFNKLFFGSLQLAVVYAIPDIGKVFLNVLGPGNDIFDDIKDDNYGTIGLSFLLTAVPGIDVQVGFSTQIPGEVKEYPTNLALIANYNGEGFGVRFRSRFVIGTKDFFEVGADVQPWINLGPVTAYLNIGFISTDGDGSGGADAVAQFILNPYIRMGFGGGSLRLGVLFKDINLSTDEGTHNGQPNGTPNAPTISVPLIFGYSF